MGRGRSRNYESDSSDDNYVVLAPGKKVFSSHHSHHGSDSGRRSRRGGSPPQDITVKNYLTLPQEGRRRATSTGGNAQPVINMIYEPSERSRSRHRAPSRASSSSCSGYSHSRHRHSGTIREEDLPYELRRKIDRLELEEEEERIKKRTERERILWQAERDEVERKEKKKREQILEDARIEAERKKKEAEEMKKKILAEEEDRKKKEKEKQEKEDREFEEKVKEKFLRAGKYSSLVRLGLQTDESSGYSLEHIEEVLHRKREKNKERDWAIDVSRPTYIKVRRKYLHPDTLDAYHLPWEWDSVSLPILLPFKPVKLTDLQRDDDYIIIKKYISHELQEELFEHTRVLHKRKLITGPMTKETTTITKLKPNDVRKDKDQMYLVREKSKSPARLRRASFFLT